MSFLSACFGMFVYLQGNQILGRFGFPLPPMKKTVILEPLDECVEKHKSMYKEIQEKINSLHELDNIEDLTFEELSICEYVVNLSVEILLDKNNHLLFQ
jgi:hypothetical protein